MVAYGVEHLISNSDLHDVAYGLGHLISNSDLRDVAYDVGYLISNSGTVSPLCAMLTQLWVWLLAPSVGCVASSAISSSALP